MKTIRQWLEDLEPAIKARALLNMDIEISDANLEEYLDLQRASLSSALSTAFSWSESHEGHDFWNKIASGHKNIRLPLLPEQLAKAETWVRERSRGKKLMHTPDSFDIFSRSTSSACWRNPHDIGNGIKVAICQPSPRHVGDISIMMWDAVLD